MHPSLSDCIREVVVAGCLSILSFQQGLPVFEDGFAYKECMYIYRSKRGTQEYCKDQHR
jgi:hypothetical protein